MEMGKMTKLFIAPSALAVGLVLGLSGCTNSNDPGQRAVGSGLIGAGARAAIGAAAAGGGAAGGGAAAGAAIGGAVGAVTGAARTPPAPPCYWL